MSGRDARFVIGDYTSYFLCYYAADGEREYRTGAYWSTYLGLGLGVEVVVEVVEALAQVGYD